MQKVNHSKKYSLFDVHINSCVFVSINRGKQIAARVDSSAGHKGVRSFEFKN